MKEGIGFDLGGTKLKGQVERDEEEEERHLREKRGATAPFDP